MKNNLLRSAAALAALLLAAAPAAQAQTPGVGIGTATPHASALLDLRSTTKGLLAPRMTTAESVAIVNPADGLLVYRTDGLQPGLWYFRAGAGWTYLNPTGGADNLGNHAATQNLALNDNGIRLRSATDPNHQLRYSPLVDGPQLFGFLGGELGYNDGPYFTPVLRWNSNSRVGIGTSNPQGTLDVGGGAVRLPGGGGDDTWFNFADNGQNYLRGTTILADNGGNVGIGTGSPTQLLEVAGTVFSSTGGFRFPDNTVQTSAAVDNQTLSLSGQTLSISKVSGAGSSVTLPADNLGNHTATQPLKLAAQPVYLNGATDLNHQLRFNQGVDGPQLFGFGGGELGYNTGSGYTGVLRWNNAGNVGIGTGGPSASALLEVNSTTKGLLPPRLSQAQRDAVSNPAAGLLVYNTDSKKLNVWNGSAWTESLATNETPLTARFDYTGGAQTWTVPAGVTSVRVELGGAKGGEHSSLAPGGAGARVTAQLAVTPGQVLNVYVGGQGGNPASGGDLRAAYNGGGWGGRNIGRGSSMSGGGGTDIRIGGTALANRVLVAGGGGAGGNLSNGQYGGGAGGYVGNDGSPITRGGSGGTQTRGGFQGGALGQGGGVSGMSGGGGGYYGGGAGFAANAGGGGGSSYASPTLTRSAQYTTGAVGSDGYVIITMLLASPAISLTEATTGQDNGAVLFSDQGKIGGDAANLSWDNTAKRLSLGTGGLRFPDNSVQTTAATDDNLGNHTATQALALADNPLYLRGAGDTNHGLRFSAAVNGPQLYGYFGGELGYNQGTYAPVLRWTETGRVGIGTVTPAFPLDVQTTLTPANYNYGYLNGNGNTGPASNSTGAVSIRATGRVLASEFNATSDRRLKTIIGLSDNAADLGLLNRLRITDYTMRDRVQYGQRQFKKVIAQEVEEVFPQAVNQHAGFLPDVYVLASEVSSTGDSLLCLTLPQPLKEAAQAGQRVKLMGEKGERTATLARAATGRTLVVRGAQELRGQKVFVFGLEHPDVRTVDYEALAMLNVSATQELARKVAELEKQNAALRTAQTQATADTRSLAQRLAALENMLGAKAEAK